MKTQVTFKSPDFNASVRKPEYVHPENYGDDLGRWLMKAISATGAEVLPGLGQEEHGWYFTFMHERVRYDFLIARDSSEWVGLLEKFSGLLPTIFGAKDRISPSTLAMVDEVLKSLPGVTDLAWHRERHFRNASGRRRASHPLVAI